MAWQSLGYELNVTLVDSGENKGTKSYELTAATNADAVTESLIIVTALEAVCAAGTVAYSIKEVFVNDALVIPTDSQVQLEANALFLMRDSVNPLKTHITRIPAPEEDVFLTVSGDGQNIVDVTHQDVLDYVNLFDGTGEATISDGESVETDGIIRGRRTTRHSKRG